MLWQSLLNSVEAGDDLATTGKPDLKQRTGFFGQRRLIDVRHASAFWIAAGKNGSTRGRGQCTSLRRKSTEHQIDRLRLPEAPILNAVARRFRLEHGRGQAVTPETEGRFIGLMRQHPRQRGERVKARIKPLELLIFNRIQTGSARPAPERQPLSNHLCPIAEILDTLLRPTGPDRTQDASHLG